MKENYRFKIMYPNQAVSPDPKTVNAYHSTLMSDPDITLRVGKEKDVHCRVGETSLWSMLSNVVGLLLVSCVIGDIPPQFRFVNQNTGEGIILARQMIPQAYNVPIDKVYFLP